MALTRIQYGGDVESGVLNDNFDYLDDRITDVGSSISTIQSNIQSVNSTLSSQINQVGSSVSTATLQAIYPVGSIYIGTMSTCPLASLFGTWTKVSEGRVLQGSDNDNGAGTTIAAALPNITGSFNGAQLYDSSPVGYGAFGAGGSDSKATPGSGGDSGQRGFYFNASRCSSIYQDEVDTVQPPAYVVNIWERTA